MTPKKRRTHSRVPAGLSVNIRSADGSVTSTERIGNISLGGVFIEMSEPLRFGSEVTLDFTLPATPHRISCRGFVVWSSKEPEPKSGRPPGIGVRLMDIGLQEMRQLAEYVEGRL